ncbi:hypothetical protein FACS189449_11330 [Alphaproteobacteria bacterium]|nr:hypothetical protein FACS189449_11330 [Alphaproteobacteria bacterium]
MAKSVLKKRMLHAGADELVVSYEGDESRWSEGAQLFAFYFGVTVKTGGVLMTSKPHDIPNGVVVEAFKQVKANRGSAGVPRRRHDEDGGSGAPIRTVQADLSNHLAVLDSESYWC